MKDIKQCPVCRSMVRVPEYGGLPLHVDPATGEGTLSYDEIGRAVLTAPICPGSGVLV